MISIIKNCSVLLKRKRNDFKTDSKERIRLSVLLIGIIFFLDYLLFCYHTDHNIFFIFPDLPIIQDHYETEIYLPALEKDNLFTEKRSIPVFSNKVDLIRYYIKLITRGSTVKNTRMLVPYKLFIKKIWLQGNNDQQNIHCIIDIEINYISGKIEPVPNSEKFFRLAVKKTILTNIPEIKKVTIVTNGNPEGYLWNAVD